jgi:hypothetical protein
MTVAATLRNRDWIPSCMIPSCMIPAGAMPRGLVAGAAWGLTMGLGLPLMNFVNCGMICLSDVAFTTAVSVVAGIAVIGPLATFRPRTGSRTGSGTGSRLSD